MRILSLHPTQHVCAHNTSAPINALPPDPPIPPHIRFKSHLPSPRPLLSSPPLVPSSIPMILPTETARLPPGVHKIFGTKIVSEGIRIRKL